MKRYLIGILGFLAFLFPISASAQFTTQQGGTGTTSPSGILYGDGTLHMKTVTIGSNLTFSGGTLSATGGGSGGGLATSSLTATYPISITTSSSAINFSLLNMATTTATCSGSVSCTSFTVIGSSPVTITGTNAVSSVFGRTGTVTAQSGDYTSDQVTQGSTNLYSQWITQSGGIYNNTGNVSIGTSNKDDKVTIYDNANQGTVELKNTSSSGYASFDMEPASGSGGGGFGYANPSASVTNLANKVYLFSNGVDIALSKDTGTTVSLDINGTTGSVNLATLGTGLVKSTSGTLSNATAGTDYAAPTSGTSLLYGNGAGGFSNATVGTGLSFTGGTLSSTALTSDPNWLETAGYLTPTSTVGIIVAASSTIVGAFTETGNMVNGGTFTQNIPSSAGTVTIDGNSSTVGTSLSLTDLNTAGNAFTDFLNPSGSGGGNLATLPLTATFQTNTNTTGGMVFFTKGTGAPIVFATGGNAKTNERLLISATGQVAINNPATSTPYAWLSIAGSAGGTTPLLAVSTSTSGFATTSVFTIDQNGNTTIGNNGSVFTVNGATSTHANGINLMTGCFAIAGTCISGGGGSNASSTLLSDNNTFSGVDNFTNASSNFAGTLGGDSLSTILSSAFSTTSASYFLSINQGNAFSTTSANYLLGTKGYLTSAVTSVGAVYPLSSTGGNTPVISSATSSASSAGVLSAADWSTFNGKQAAGSYLTALTGDGTASGPGSGALTLATVNSNIGSFTNANITVNAKGLVTAASNGSAGAASTTLLIDNNTWSGSNTFNISPNIGVNTNGIMLGGISWAYASSTNDDTIFGLDAGGNNATTSSTFGYEVAVGDHANAALTTGTEDTSVGYASGRSQTTGTANTALGWSALGAAALTGSDNTGLGVDSFQSLTTALRNTGVGYLAGETDGTGNDNTDVGYETGICGGSGCNIADETAVGSGALLNDTNGSNTAVGFDAETTNSTGSQNTAVGFKAGEFTSSAVGNTSVGYQAFVQNSVTHTAADNTSIGASANLNLSTGGSNTAVGYLSNDDDTSGSGNSFLGYETGTCGGSGCTIAQDTGVGYESLSNDQTGANTAVGYESMLDDNGGGFNTAVGWSALLDGVSAIRNTGVGYEALDNATAAYGRNTGVGYGAGAFNTTGTGNVIMGSVAGGASGSTFASSTFIGVDAGFADTSGSENTLIGAQPDSDTLTTGSQNIEIGYDAQVPSNTNSGQMSIGNIIYGTGNTGTVGSVSTGNIGIATTTPGSIFSIAGVANFTAATSTFYGNGINLTSGCYAINGTCISGGGGGGSVTGVTATYPILSSGGTAPVISTAISTSTLFALSDWFATTSAPQLTTLANLATVGTITSGTWNGTPVADSFIASSGNWNTAYTNRITSINNDTNVTGTIGSNAITLGWTGTLADGRIASSANWNTAYTNRITSANYPLSISSNALSIVATSSENCTVTCFASANISQWTNNAGYLTSLSGAASSTLLGDNNTFSGKDIFSNATTTLLTATTEWLPSLGTSAGSFLAVDPNGKIIATTTPSGSSLVSGTSLAVQLATTGALPANTYSTGVLTEVGTGALTVDGTAVAIGNRILVKNEVAQTNNGIYSVTAAGSGIAAYVLTRVSDYNSSSNVVPGEATYVVGGSTLNDDWWALTTVSPITVGGGGSGSNLTYVETNGSTMGTVTSVGASSPNSTLTLGGTNPVTSSGTINFDLNLTNPNAWTGRQNFNNSTSTLGTITTGWATNWYDTYASSTAVTVSGQEVFSNLASALVVTNGSGVLANYAGASNPCTNQLPTTISALGVLGGCSSVSNAMLSNSTIGATSPNSTLTFGTAASLGSTFTADLNLGTSNQWTASTTFTKVVNAAYASSTAITVPTIFSSATSSIVTGNGTDIGNGSHGIRIYPGSSTTTISFY